MPATIRSIDMQIIDKIFGMEDGYVLDFSDRSMAQFFAEDLNIDIDHLRYRDEGSSRQSGCGVSSERKTPTQRCAFLTRSGNTVRRAGR